MPTDVSRLLLAWREGDLDARDQLVPLVYDDLRALARRYSQNERQITLQPTAVIHEAFLRLVGSDIPWTGRTHFFAVAAGMIRRILVDEARRRNAVKRGAGDVPLTLDEALVPDERPPHLLALDAALEDLAAVDARKARVVELRFFGGLTIAETAEILDVSETTIERDLRLAKAWLADSLAPSKS